MPYRASASVWAALGGFLGILCCVVWRTSQREVRWKSELTETENPGFLSIEHTSAQNTILLVNNRERRLQENPQANIVGHECLDGLRLDKSTSFDVQLFQRAVEDHFIVLWRSQEFHRGSRG